MSRSSALVAVVVALVAPATATAAVRAPGAAGPLGDERLSNETTVTRWAHPAARATVRSAPRASAAAVDHLRFWTEHESPEVYLALESRRVDGRPWVRIRLPGRPNGRTGWVPASALGRLNVVRTQLVVNRRTLRATLYQDGWAIWRAPVGVGAPATPTPAGRFWVRERLRGNGGVYGPWAFGTSGYSSMRDWWFGGVVGIHGTNEPGLIPGRPSHGCIRVRNADLVRLVKRMPIGTPIRIR
ncbi:L,D-transpeptidase [Solirubrobacter sp. CPCC 204708]|uniref:L,D-transpeptidase n=1 Tax=Solirubrobacter deserti TaxID=2282478 RepID=A0ABT4RBP0_9ACTN|nr:L,D-transpeptidase [Solirubrobacter deserti]MBE2317159.1 L,D-transpeptidase [Solirubrobacter deserti]MDA0135948.1 L,D-transpeptidase [Solirubrobacter deserti]